MENDDEHKRHLLSAENDDTVLSKPRDAPTTKLRKMVLKSSITFSVIAVLSTLVYLALFFKWTHSISICRPSADGGDDIKSKGPATLSCGKTREEAISRGCIFDVLSVGWVPPACYDKERATSFKKMATVVSYGRDGPFPWWRDANHTIPIAEDELSEMSDNPVAYTTEEFHQQHCLYVWKTTSAALTEAQEQKDGVWALDRISDPHHIQHCLIVLESMPSRYNKSVEVDFGYRDCIMLNVE